MEQPSTRIPQRKVRRATPVPRPATPVGPGESAAVYRAGRASPPLRALGRGPRLTGLGAGLLTTLWMLAVGALIDSMGGSGTAYGAFFLFASVICALWVR
ncbi:hypothetical protein ACFQ2B_10540 [Streptomyces stramineus]